MNIFSIDREIKEQVSKLILKNKNLLLYGKQVFCVNPIHTKFH